ncbi:MAG: NAD-dependent epimerase/dehydratase family protein [Cyanobacteria bacterium J06600_6]
MKLAIIGCGYVGSAVARLWHATENEVTVTTTTPSKVAELEKVSSRVVILEGNDLASLKQLLADQDVVLLSIGSKQRTPEVYRQTYLETAHNLVKAIANSQVKQLIYTGSYGIIKAKSGNIIDETVVVKPQDEFGEILHQTEQVLLSASHGNLKTCILRLTGIYGPGRELIRIFQRVAGTTRPGSGEGYTNWVHLEDIARAINFAKDQQLEGIYHLNSDEFMTTKKFLNKLFQAHNLPPVVWDSSQPSTRSYSMKLSNAKLKNAGFTLAHPQIEFK